MDKDKLSLDTRIARARLNELGEKIKAKSKEIQSSQAELDELFLKAQHLDLLIRKIEISAQKEG